MVRGDITQAGPSLRRGLQAGSLQLGGGFPTAFGLFLFVNSTSLPPLSDPGGHQFLFPRDYLERTHAPPPPNVMK